MHTFTTIVAASGLIASISASPLLARQTCGSTPSSSGSQEPLAQPTGITTAQACEAQCEANASCLSFVFGMVDNTVECKLYSVAASSVPAQSSTNLVVYDKACSSIPAVVPTTSNPTGAATSSSNTSTNTNTGTGFNTNTNTDTQNHKRDTCGSTPTATTSQAPLSTPAGITTAAACQAQCEAQTSCLSFVFGMVDSSDKCILYAVAASAVPTQSGSGLVVYDKECASSAVPTQTPTASNPTGANTGSTGSTGTGSTTGTGNTRANGAAKSK